MPIQIVRKTKGGLDYIGTVLRDRKSVVTRAVFWRVPHRQTNKEDIGLKIGRYTRLNFDRETLQATGPKSELTLDDEEFRKLLQFFSRFLKGQFNGKRQVAVLARGWPRLKAMI